MDGAEHRARPQAPRRCIERSADARQDPPPAARRDASGPPQTSAGGRAPGRADARRGRASGCGFQPRRRNTPAPRQRIAPPRQFQRPWSTAVEAGVEIRHRPLRHEQNEFVDIRDEIVDRANGAANAVGQGFARAGPPDPPPRWRLRRRRSAWRAGRCGGRELDCRPKRGWRASKQTS